MATQLIIRVDPGLKEKANRLAKSEGKNLSELVRELLLDYTRERDASGFIDGLWDRIGKNLSTTPVSDQDIEEAIRQVRSRNA